MRVEEDPPFSEQAQDQRKLPQETKRRLPKSFSQTKVEAEDDDYSYEMAEAEEFHRQKYQRENYH